MRVSFNKSILAASFLVIAGFTGSANAESTNTAGSAPFSFAPLVEKLTPAVVNISTSQKVKAGGRQMMFDFPGMPQEQRDKFKEFFENFGGMPGMGGQGGEPMEREVHSLGSGFIIDASGYVVTNNHVIDGAEEIKVILSDDTHLEAELVGRDPKIDIALLKVKHDKPLPFVSFGDSDKARVGDWIIAVGNPFGLGGTVSTGIISARSRNINSGPFDDFLQTDAAINRGSSGGPMFNMNGEVIGISTAIFSPTGGNVGIGFAVPSTLAKPILAQLKKYGRTHRGWLGVKIQHVTDEVADSVGLKKASGALILGIDEAGPAKKSGFKVGDIILSFDGKPIEKMHFLPRVVAETKIGGNVDVVVWRGGKQKILSVTLGELDESDVTADSDKSKSGKNAKPNQGEKLLGMTLNKLNGDLRKKLSLDKGIKAGVVVMQVKPNSEAAKRGLRRGDVIIGVNQDEITSVSDMKKSLKSALDSGKKFALIRVSRKGETSFVTLPTAENK